MLRLVRPLIASGLVLLVPVLLYACGGDSEGSTGQGGSGATGTGTGTVGGGGPGGSGGMGGAGAMGGMGGTGGMGGMIEPGPDAVLESIGDADKVLLRGWVVTPDQSFAGDVLIVGDTISCVAADCSGETDAATASVVTTNGIIMPGMIDSHNHILFDIFDESDWTPGAKPTSTTISGPTPATSRSTPPSSTPNSISTAKATPTRTSTAR